MTIQLIHRKFTLLSICIFFAKMRCKLVTVMIYPSALTKEKIFDLLFN